MTSTVGRLGTESINLYTGGAAIAAPLPVLLILSLPMAGQRGEYVLLIGSSLNGGTPSVTRLLLLIQQQQLKSRNGCNCYRL